MSTMLDQYLTDLVECEDHYSQNKVCEIEKENTFFFVKKNYCCLTYGKKNSTIISSIRIARKSVSSPARGTHKPLTNAPKKA